MEDLKMHICYFFLTASSKKWLILSSKGDFLRSKQEGKL
jgi:hypothetical protein